MKWSMLVLLLVIVGHSALAQKFHFGINAAGIASQVDGDELNGFNKFGFRAGLLGGYSFTDAHWLVVELQYAEYGSRKRNEDVEMNFEVDMGSINVLAAYSWRFGDSWDGYRKFRLLFGPQYNRILNGSGPNITTDALRSGYISLHGAFSYVINEALLVDLSYTHSINNVLKEPMAMTDNLVPYYLSLGLNYYIFR